MNRSRQMLLLVSLSVLAAGCSPAPEGSPGQSTATPQSGSSVGSRATAALDSRAAQLQPLGTSELKVALTAATDSCNVEAVGSTPFANAPLAVKGIATTISGWVLSGISRKPGVPAQLRFVNDAGTAGWQVPIENWIARPDVLSTMHAATSGDVGFSQEVQMGALPAGAYHVLVTFQDAGRSYSCDKGRVVELR